MRLNDVNLYIDSSPMLTLMRTKRYLNFAAKCWKMTSTVFASVVNAEMEKETPLDYDALGENADAILNVIADAIRTRQKNTTVSPRRSRCVRFFYRGRACTPVSGTSLI